MYLSVDLCPTYRIEGITQSFGDEKLTPNSPWQKYLI